MRRGRRRATFALGLTAALILGAPAAPATATPVPNLSWTELLPPRPTDDRRQPLPVATCRKAAVKCIARTAKRLRRAQNSLGCDHRAVFATTYLELTRVLRELLRERPNLVRYRKYLYYETALFANLYIRTLRAYERGGEVPPAWQVTLDAATGRSLTGVQDMLMGISAHVQRDMPFVIARLGIRAPNGESRKRDHDRVNVVLNRAYERVVRRVEQRYDPSMAISNSPLTPVDDLAGLELARVWREGVWRNAERLVMARDEQHRRRIASQIEDSAAVWAKGMALVEIPGYRAQRLDYCSARLDAGR